MSLVHEMFGLTLQNLKYFSYTSLRLDLDISWLTYRHMNESERKPSEYYQMKKIYEWNLKQIHQTNLGLIHVSVSYIRQLQVQTYQTASGPSIISNGLRPISFSHTCSCVSYTHDHDHICIQLVLCKRLSFRIFIHNSTYKSIRLIQK